MANDPQEPNHGAPEVLSTATDVVDATLDEFRERIADGEFERACILAKALPPAELRDALRGLTPEQTEVFYQKVGDKRLAPLVGQLEHEDAGDVLRRLSDAAAADVLDELAPDDAAAVIRAIKASEPARVKPILVEMDRAGNVQPLLAHLPDTAGGHMTTDFLAVRPEATASEAIRALRRRVRVGEFRSYVYVTDDANRLVGVVPLHRLILVGTGTKIADFMVPDPVRVRGTDDQEAVARIFRERHFLALPVVDLGDRLLGVITADDVADVIEEEVTEDIERLGGSQPLDEPYLRVGPLRLARKRVGWLLLLFAAEAYTGTVLRHFEDALQQVIALAFFIPLLIGTGGNTGSQTTTTVIRAMALGEVEFRDLFRIWRKELATGLLLAAVIAAAAVIRAWTLGVSDGVRFTVAVAAGAIVLWS
ncbi:MAG TPA: magnesium transporter, partial [bacterium]|nr:magnesium transporter [bacterium]